MSRVREGEVNTEEMLQQENQELLASLNQARKSAVRDERILRLLEQRIPALEVRYTPRPPLKHEPKFTPHSFVLQWSDLHAGEQVFLDQMGGVNEYDWGIMLRRHDQIIRAIESFKRNRPYPIPELVIAMGGDMVTGDIHDELKITNEKVIMETALDLGMDGARFIERLVPLFERIRVYGVTGNHGRTTRKPTAKNRFDNYDWMVYHLLKLQLANYPSVEVTIPKSAYAWFEVQGQTCFMLHGDGIPTNMPGIPWGGVQRRTRELERQFEAITGGIDHFLVHHFHQPNVVDNKRIIVNGSVKGPDEYSIQKYGAGSPASQNLLVFHPRRGMTEWIPLELQEY